MDDFDKSFQAASRAAMIRTIVWGVVVVIIAVLALLALTDRAHASGLTQTRDDADPVGIPLQVQPWHDPCGPRTTNTTIGDCSESFREPDQREHEEDDGPVDDGPQDDGPPDYDDNGPNEEDVI